MLTALLPTAYMYCDTHLTGVFGFLSGNVLANNSIVTNEEIGSEDKYALLCYTNLAECCKGVQNKRLALGQ